LPRLQRALPPFLISMQITDSNTGIIKTAINLFSTTAKKIYCYGKDIYL
jgi:hypothetical protein